MLTALDPHHKNFLKSPVRDLGHLDYDRCAALHNELLRRGWEGSGKPPKEFRTWWEVHTPSEEIENRLDPYLVLFLKRARVAEEGNHFLCYWLTGLAHPDNLFRTSERYEKLVYLFSIPNASDGHELGLMYDQDTATASYVPSIFDLSEVYEYEEWMPLEVILDAYLQINDEGKVSTVAPEYLQKVAQDEDDDEYELPKIEVNNPWYIHIFTKLDLERATSAMHRLMDAIEQRRPESQSQENQTFPFPWSDVKALDRIRRFPTGCFAFEFLKAIATSPANFRYIAPGIRLPSAAEISEFLGPKDEDGFLEWRVSRGMSDMPELWPVLIFPMDGGDLVRWPLHYRGIVRTGLYIATSVPINDTAFGDECILVLPFKLGANGWARKNDGVPIKECRKFDDSCDHVELYQEHGIGFNNGHKVQIYKVLENWAQRVEDGDWEVGEDGVIGGP